MQNPTNANRSPGKNLLSAFKRKIADPDEPFGLKDSNDIAQVLVANRGTARRVLTPGVCWGYGSAHCSPQKRGGNSS